MNENYNKDFAVPHCPGFDASGSVLPVLLPVFRHGVRHCRVSVVPAGDRGIVRRTGGRIYRLPVLAWLVSPYGLPLAASWLTERVADFNHMLKSI